METVRHVLTYMYIPLCIRGSTDVSTTHFGRFDDNPLDVSSTNMCECRIAKMTVNPVQMLALIAEATDARPLPTSSFQMDLDKQ